MLYEILAGSRESPRGRCGYVDATSSVHARQMAREEWRHLYELRDARQRGPHARALLAVMRRAKIRAVRWGSRLFAEVAVAEAAEAAECAAAGE